jgi:hypothetical protein
MSRSRMLIIMEKLPVSTLVNEEYPDGIPMSDPTSVRDTAALAASKLWQSSLKYQRDSWKYGDIEFTINPDKTAVVATVELTRWD